MQRLPAFLLFAGLAAAANACGGTSSAPDAADASPPDATDAFVSPDVTDAPEDAATDATAVAPEISFWKVAPGAPDQRVESLTWGESFDVRVGPLAPGARVTVHSYYGAFHGRAAFDVGAAGDVDVARDAPADGTYTGVDRDGLLWSMVDEDDAAPPPTTYDLRFVLEINGATATEATLHRTPLGVNTRHRMVSDNGLVGALFSPNDGNPHPTVLVVSGSEGGLTFAQFRAAHLAEHGYTALGLAYFGIGSLPATLTEVPLEYFGTALDWLATQPEVDAQRIAVLGTSRGGELVLQLGATFPSVRAVVAEVPSHVRWGETGFHTPLESAWTYQGAPLAFVPPAPGNPRFVRETLPSGDSGYRFAPTFLDALADATPEQIAAATIAVENTAGPVLLLGSADDGEWPSCDFVADAMDRLRAQGHTARYAGDDSVCFPDAGHFLGPFGGPTTNAYAYYDAPLGDWLIMGGTPKGTADAQRAEQDRILAFLAAALR